MKYIISFNALKLLSVSIASIILLDIIAGLIFIHTNEIHIRTFNPYYHHGLKGNGHSVESWAASKKYEMYTNSLGFRDREIRNVDKTSNKHRILFIGDSFTEGVGVGYDNTFAGICGKELSPDCEVLNAGVISYSAATYYLKTKYLIEHDGLKFNEIIVFSDISDVYNDYSHEVLEKFRPELKTSQLSSAIMSVNKFLGNHSFFYHSFKIIYPYVALRKYEKTFPYWTVNDEVFNDWGKNGLEISGEYMQKLVDLCKQNNIRVTVAVYPWPNLIEARDLNSRQVSFWAEFTEKNKIGFINLFPYFINEQPSLSVIEKYFSPGDIHWNSEGHKVVAAEILKYIRTSNVGE